MKLTLAIETSGARYGLALGADGALLHERAEEGAGRDLAAMLSHGLEALGAAPADIAAIAVDIGPGSLGSLRDGVAFANGLAYALGRPVYPFLSFELTGAVAHGLTGLPVLCTRRANEGLAYAGVYDGARVTTMRHGRLPDLVAQLATAPAMAAAGSFRELAVPGGVLRDSGVAAPEARTMLTIGLSGRPPADALRSPVFPLTEASEAFA